MGIVLFTTGVTTVTLGLGVLLGWLLAGRRHSILAARADLARERELTAAYRAAAFTDSLTGLANRRSFDEHLAALCADSSNANAPVSLILVDVDHFKTLNDHYGHPTGDTLLREIGQVLQSGVRSSDLVARCGGEEFGIVLPGTTLAQALIVADRLRRAVSDCDFGLVGNSDGVTISAGVAEAVTRSGRESLLLRADRALYAAKASGRDCCRVADDALDTH